MLRWGIIASEIATSLLGVVIFGTDEKQFA